MTSKKSPLTVEQYKSVHTQDDHSNPIILSEIIEDIQTSPGFEEIVKKIRESTNKEKQKALKKELPIFRPCVSVPCYKPYETNGIVQLDVDDISIEKAIQYKKLVNDKIPQLIYAFISPRGGLKLAVLTDLIGEDEDAYTEAYYLVVRHIGQILGKKNAPEFDHSCKSIYLNCYLSSDIDAYYCEEPERLKLKDKVIGILKEKAFEKEKKQQEHEESLSGESTYSKTEDKDVQDALSVIPRDFHYDERLPINFAIFSHFGSKGIDLLFNHWVTSDRKKLQNDLKVQLQSHNKRDGRKSTIATLFDEAKKHGYSPAPPRNTEKAEDKGKEPTYPVAKFYTQDEASTELDKIIEKFIDTKKNTAVLFEAGAGKTWGSLKKLNTEHLKRKRNFRVAYFVNNKKIAQERKNEMVIGDDDNERLIDVLKIVEKAGSGVSVMKGFGEDTCPLWKEGDIYNRNRCDGCNYWAVYQKLCPYEHQYLGQHQAGLDSFRLYQHAHLFQPSRLDRIEPVWVPDVIVVDEDVVSNMLKKEYVKKGTGSSLIDLIIDELAEDDCKDVSSVARSYEEYLKLEIPKLLRNKKIEELNKKEKALYEVVRVLRSYAKSATIPHASVWLEDDIYLYVGWIKRIDKKWYDVPMLYLDASGSKKIISRVLKRKFEFHKIRCHYQSNVNVVQVQNNTVSKGWCNDNRDKIKSFIELMEQKPHTTKTGFISYLNVNSKPFIEDLLNDENTYGWFGKLRGSNKFKEFSQLIVLGRQFIDKKDMVRMAKIIYRNWDHNWCMFRNDEFEPRPFNDAMRPVEKTVRMKDGKHLTLKTNQYIDYRLHELSEHLDHSETYQALHRLRLVHGNNRKQVVYVSKDVNDITVDQMVDDTAIFITDTRREFVELVFANDGKIKLKSNKQIAGLMNKTEKQIAKMKENNKEWMKHNIFFYVNDDGYCTAI